MEMLTVNGPAGQAGALPPAPAVAFSLSSRRILAGLGLVTLAAIALRLWRIDAAGYWSDELFSIFWVRQGLDVLWGVGLHVETTPPLYYTLLKPWTAAFGETELAGRGFSALFSALAVPLTYRLAREFAPPGAALLAAALLALSPLQLLYAQEARAYAMLPALYALALLGLVRFCRSGGAGALALYGVMALLLVYTHATSAFTLAALNLVGFGWLLLSRPAGWAAAFRLAAVNVVVVALSVPQILAMIGQQGRFDLAWIPKPDLVGLFGLAGALLADPTPALRLRHTALLALAIAGLLAVLLWRVWPGRRAMLFLAAPPAIFLAVTLLLSLWSPFFLPRIAVWVTVPLAVLLAMVLTSPAAPGWARGGLAVVLALGIGFGLRGVLVTAPAMKEDFRGLAAAMAPQVAPADTIALGPRTNLLGLAFYLEESRQQARWQPAGAPEIQLAPFSPEGVPDAVPLPSAALAARVRAGQRVWLVLNPRDAEEFLEAALVVVPEVPPSVDRRWPLLTVLFWDPAGAR
ncbi:membrane protein [Siccirubricoccus deserti]|uniref:Glycosyltransferase family 39 protein n=1 Tax=Siccirubricoccus deserti TaxID=2013562 RepID=A0A9X0QW18_9PROT|nr:glycosyltransferase family 39 protein [Siccirubricoccus deserti]MBC4014512.1 glycosyltransferase family 39 protein [Siccirubricoccus deserti]GGC32323.1 membrane protein [Siccirubricoccus deserti]